MFSLSIVRNAISRINAHRSLYVSAALRNNLQTTEQIVLETRDITKDRTEPVPLEKSLRYLKSEAYRQTYGGQPVWVQYRRNHKGQLPPKKTRKTCVRSGQISTGNPCPICRDEYLVLDDRNIDLLRQFICPHTGSILSYTKTGLCQKKHQELVICILRAYDKGLLTFDVPFRTYDYSEYYSDCNKN